MMALLIAETVADFHWITGISLRSFVSYNSAFSMFLIPSDSRTSVIGSLKRDPYRAKCDYVMLNT